MIQPNRLSVPGEAAARQRVEVVFEAIDGIPTDRLHGVALSPRDEIVTGWSRRSRAPSRRPAEAPCSTRHATASGTHYPSDWPQCSRRATPG